MFKILMSLLVDYGDHLSGSAVYALPRSRTKFWECGFFYSSPAAWNTLLQTWTTSLTPVHSENDSRVYFLIMLTTDYCWRSQTCHIVAPYKFCVDGLIDCSGISGAELLIIILSSIMHSCAMWDHRLWQLPSTCAMCFHSIHLTVHLWH